MWSVKAYAKSIDIDEQDSFFLNELWSTEEVDKKLAAFRELNQMSGTHDIIHIDDDYILVEAAFVDWEFCRY